MLTLLLLPLSAQAQTGPASLAGILDAPGPAVAASFAPSSHGPYPYWNKVLTASTTGSPTTLLTGAPKQSVPIDCSNSPSCDAGLEVGMCLQAIPPSECDLLCEKSGIFCADDFEFRTDGSHHNAGATKACAKGTVVGEVCSQAAGMTGGESGGVKNCDAFVDGVLPDYKSDALRSQYKLIGFCESGQLWDDPHVMTLSGNQFFMHGVGVFDYASIPGVIKTQVHMHIAPTRKSMPPPPATSPNPTPSSGVHVSVCAVHLRDDGVGGVPHLRPGRRYPDPAGAAGRAHAHVQKQRTAHRRQRP